MPRRTNFSPSFPTAGSRQCTNIYRDVILDEKDFPVKMTAYTPCSAAKPGRMARMCAD